MVQIDGHLELFQSISKEDGGDSERFMRHQAYLICMSSLYKNAKTQCQKVIKEGVEGLYKKFILFNRKILALIPGT